VQGLRVLFPCLRMCVTRSQWHHPSHTSCLEQHVPQWIWRVRRSLGPSLPLALTCRNQGALTPLLHFRWVCGVLSKGPGATGTKTYAPGSSLLAVCPLPPPSSAS